MRSAAAVLAALVLAGVIGLVAAALLNERSQAFTLGVAPATGTKVKPRQTACQQPITVPADGAFDGITVAVGTKRRAGPPLDVSVRGVVPSDNKLYASGTLSAGYRGLEPTERTVWIARVPSERIVEVCMTNRGRRSAFIFGDDDAAARSSLGSINGKPADADFALRFERRPARSLADLVPAIIDRAALFRPGWVGSWTYLVLAALVLLAVPAVLIRALGAAERS